MDSRPRTDVDPKKWGPAAWKFIGATIEGYPDAPSDLEVHGMADFITSLGTVIPCSKCRSSFDAYRAEHPLKSGQLRNRDELRRWFTGYKRAHAATTGTQRPKPKQPAPPAPTREPPTAGGPGEPEEPEEPDSPETAEELERGGVILL